MPEQPDTAHGDGSERPSTVDPLRPLPPLTWHDRLNELTGRLRNMESRHAPIGVLVAAGAGLVAFAGLAVWAGLSLLRPAQAAPPELALPRASTMVAAAATSTASSHVLVVQAAGAVNGPGLYRLPDGARVDDLVRAAGGFAADADPDRVNLAAPIEDGTRVYIPHRGEGQPPEPVVGGGAAPASSSGASASSNSAPVNLNTATQAQFEGLPGIGPALAKAMVDYRSAHGRFGSIDQLLEVRGIGPSKLDVLRPLLTL